MKSQKTSRVTVTNPKKFSLMLLLGILVIGAILFRLVWGSGTIAKTGEIEIVQGEDASHVWRNLVEQGYSDRTIPWKYYGRLNDNAAKVQAGVYQIEKGERAKNVLDRFVRGDVQTNEFSVTFPEGFTLTQIANRYADRTGNSAQTFLDEAMANKYAQQFPFLAGLSETRTLEGYLFPDTYRITPSDTPKDIIMRMLGNFDRKVPEEMRSSMPTGRTLDDIIIMASIVEKEVQSDDDMALVAGVLWKRIDNKEGLYADATIEYIVEKNGSLTVEDLALDSPYNTRKYRGLPPGPISNPGLRAIDAALNPQESEYYYYLTAKDGTTIFSKTNDEHNQNKAKYL